MTLALVIILSIAVILLFVVVLSGDYGSFDPEKSAEAKRAQAEAALAERERRVRDAERLAEVERREAALREQAKSRPAVATCRRCGQTLRSTAAFCTRCGVAVDG